MVYYCSSELTVTLASGRGVTLSCAGVGDIDSIGVRTLIPTYHYFSKANIRSASENMTSESTRNGPVSF